MTRTILRSGSVLRSGASLTPPPWWSVIGTAMHWWHAEDGAIAGAALPDRVGSANFTVGAGTPTYSATGWGLSPQPVIELAPSDYITANTSVGSGDDTPITVSVSFQSANSPSTRVVTFGNTADQATHGLWLSNTGAAVGEYTVSRRSNAGTYLDTGASGVAIGTARHVITWAFYGTTCTVYMDGVRVSDAVSLDSPAMTFDNLTIGGWVRAGGAVNQGAIDIGEIVIFDEGVADTGALASLHATHLARWPVTSELLVAPLPDGLVGWWDFSDASTLTLATNEVTAVASKSATGFGAIVPVTTGPTLVSAGQNGLDYATFNTNPLTQGVEVPSLFLPGEATLFVIARVDGANRGLIDVHRGAGSATNVGALLFSASVESCRAQGLSAGLKSATATDPTTGVAWRVFGGRFAGTGLTARINGVTANDATFQLIASAQFLDGVTVGGLGGSGTTFPAINSDIGEVLVYNRGLTDAEMDAIEAYLEAKWG